jgi:nucleolar protein 58
MLLLFETPAGYALFKVLDEGKIKNVDNIFKHFESASAATGLYVYRAWVNMTHVRGCVGC